MKSLFDIKIGHDNKWYAVFPSNFEREDYAREYPLEVNNFQPASYGQFDNAYCLGNVENTHTVQRMRMEKSRVV